jgi:uncharacterized membrane protein
MAKPRSKRQPRSKRSMSVLEMAVAHIRFIIAIIVGIAVWTFAPLDEPLLRFLAAWNAAGWLFIALVLIMMTQAEIKGIKRQASLEDESRAVLLTAVILGSIATLLAIVTQLSALSKEHGPDRTLIFALSFSTILVSWFLIHIVFAAYYAHEFHSEARGASYGHGGGLHFPGDRIPDYLDFLYFSFVVGTTAQTSDVEITSHRMRRVVMGHGLLSFFFNTTVIALVVNLTAQLAG